jgi:hypothetical protein
MTGALPFRDAHVSHDHEVWRHHASIDSSRS